MTAVADDATDTAQLAAGRLHAASTDALLAGERPELYPGERVITLAALHVRAVRRTAAARRFKSEPAEQAAALEAEHAAWSRFCAAAVEQGARAGGPS